MSEIENHFTVFIRLPFNRGDFVDPPSASVQSTRYSSVVNVLIGSMERKQRKGAVGNHLPPVEKQRDQL
jgi:Atg29 N-terminal domain